MKKSGTFLLLMVIAMACSSGKPEKKGFQVSSITENEKGEKVVGLPIDSLELETTPRGVLLTRHAKHRLTPIFKISYNKKGQPYSGSTYFHRSWRYKYPDGNNWNENYLPGFSAAFGPDLVNVSHYDTESNDQNEFFDRPVLIKTLYYPAYSMDTLNYQPVKRDFYMVSVYDKDTNRDGFINVKDLRRLYHFDLDGTRQGHLVPTNYSVMSSLYDSGNDYMYIYARLDQNANGQMEVEEPTHVFWIDLKDPERRGMFYQPQ